MAAKQTKKPSKPAKKDSKPPKEKPVNKGGRPSSFDPKFIKQAFRLSLLGLTDVEMADIFEVTEATFNNWKKQKPGFLSSIKKGKELADSRVVQSLYRRAIGYSHPEDDIRAVNGSIVITPTIKHYPPDPVACIYWLNNRRRKTWSNKPPEGEEDSFVPPVPQKIEYKPKQP